MIDKTLNRRTVLQASAAAAAFPWLATSAVAQDASPAAAPPVLPDDAAETQTLRFGFLAASAQLDPHFSYGRSSTGPFTNQMWAGLTKVTADLDVVPDIALSWDLSEDGLLYTFHLDPNRTFSDGTPITSATVLGSWFRSLDPANESIVSGGYFRDVIGAADYWNGSSTELPAGMRAVDDLTIEVELMHPRNYFPKILTHPCTFIVNPDEVATDTPDDRWYMRAQSFSGPFAVESYEERQSLMLVRNEHYPIPPLLERIEYRLVDDPQTLFLMYQNDEVDLTLLGTADADNVKNEDETYRAELVEQPIWWLDNFYTRQEIAPFEDPLVRSAFARAIDRDTLLSVVERNLYQAMDGIFHPELDVYEETPPVLTFDPEGAAADLAASTYGSVDALPPISFHLTSAEATGTENTRAAAIQEMWRQNLGVEVELRVVPTFEELLESDVQLLIGSEGMQYPDASNGVAYLLCDSGSNWAQFCNEDFEGLIDEAAQTQDMDLAKSNYNAAQQIVLESASLRPMWRRANYFVVKPRVGNFVTTAMYTFPSFATDLYIKAE